MPGNEYLLTRSDFMIPNFGLHVLDMNLPMENLVDIIGTQLQAAVNAGSPWCKRTAVSGGRLQGNVSQ